jgi:hypothetical protein
MEDPEAGEQIEGESDSETPGASADPGYERPIDRFRRSAAGTAIAAGMFGLRDALEGRPEREETVMEVPARGSVVDDDLDVVVDLAHPENSRIVVRRPAEPPKPS